MAPMKVTLFGSDRLNIFVGKPTSTTSTMSTPPELPTWQSLQARELRLATTHPPANALEEMILWTEQGKLWTFPIDNEQGLDEERRVYFSDHVFLEPLLEPWCPPRGPVRHFMELVCVGLSKNPYLTVAEKRAHVAWFRDYFGDKQEILRDTGALETAPEKPVVAPEKPAVAP